MPHIRWGRVLAGALLVELTMMAIIVPLNAVSASAAYFSVPVLAFATAVLFGRWAARPLAGGFILHGVLVAVAASLMYITLTVAAGVSGDLPMLYHVSHAVRVAGGAVGGLLARRSATPVPAATA